MERTSATTETRASTHCITLLLRRYRCGRGSQPVSRSIHRPIAYQSGRPSSPDVQKSAIKDSRCNAEQSKAAAMNDGRFKQIANFVGSENDGGFCGFHSMTPVS